MCKSYLDEDEPHENRYYGKEQSTDEHEYSRDYICAEEYHCGNPTTAKREKYGELTSLEVLNWPHKI